MSEDNFLRRWSERKRQIAQEAAKDAAKAPKDASAGEFASGEPEAGAEEPFDLSLLPKIEDLTPASDITLFMRKGVPDALRNAALRRMWTLDPAVRDYRSEALDYAWDWNAPGGVPGGGDLGPGFDSREMVARIFGEPGSDEKVIEDVAVQQDPAEVAGNTGEKPVSGEAPEGVVTEKPAESSMKPQVEAADADDTAMRKPRRHGSALPAILPKSLMS